MRRWPVYLPAVVALAAGGCQSVELSPAVKPVMRQVEVMQEEVRQLSTQAPEGTLVLSLEGCMALALGGNLEIELGRLGPLTRGEDFFIAGEAFQPTVTIEGGLGELEARTANTQVGADIFEETTRTLDAELSRRWSLGTRTDLRWAYDRRQSNSEFRSLNPSHQSLLELEVEQPLLEGFGVAVNRAELDQALNERRIAEHEFELVLEGELLGAYRAYWLLAARALDRDLQLASLELAREQVALTRDQLEAGRAAPLDLVAAEAAEARQQESVISAQAAYNKASDELLRRIRPATGADGFRIQLLPSTEPDHGEALPEVPDFPPLADAALAHRPELAMQALRVNNTEIDLRVAKNAAIPVLDAYGRFGYGGLAADAQGAFDESLSGDFPDWEVGAKLQFFFLGESRFARVRQARLERASADLRYERMAADVLVDVRAALYDLDSAIQRVTATRRTLVLAQEQYEGEVDRLKVGRSTVFQVDRIRRDLLDAQRSRVRAEVDLFIARALLEATQGLFAKGILERVEFPEAAPTAQEAAR